jgi:membrane dipeptidase
MKRRELFQLMGKGSLALGMYALLGNDRDLFPQELSDTLYRRAISVDAMCFTTEEYVPYMDPGRVEALRTSGITVISLDVSIGGGPGMGKREWPVVVHQIAQWNEFFDNHPDVFLRVYKAEDVLEAKKKGKVGIIFNMQDTTPIAQNLDRIGLFYDLGVRQIQLSHNQRNFVVDSCWETTNAGLSRFGRRVIKALNDQNILIDIAHVGERSCLETISLSKAPVLASHTGCYALCPHPRSKPDHVIKAMADRGGLICLYNMSNWMTKDPVLSMDIFIRHLKHAISVAGEDHVGFGTDGDPSAMTPERLEWEIDLSQESFDADVKDHPQLTWKIKHMRIKELNSPARLLNLTIAMEKAGYKERTIEKIIGGNYFRLFREVVG